MSSKYALELHLSVPLMAVLSMVEETNAVLRRHIEVACVDRASKAEMVSEVVEVLRCNVTRLGNLAIQDAVKRAVMVPVAAEPEAGEL